MKKLTMTLTVAVIFIISARGQGFLNLNFDLAKNLPANPPEDGASVSVTNALPDWTAYSGDMVLSAISYVSNNFGGFSSSVELEGGSLALSGNNLSVGLYLDGSISQTGMVPNNAESLQFEAHGNGAGGSLGGTGFAVTLGGQSLSYSALTTGPNYVLYGANIPADMDGQSEALTFLCEGIGSGNVLLDNIEFSSMSVPEPSQFTLVGLGVVLFGLRHLRRK
jgi:hypothetical protein